MSDAEKYKWGEGEAEALMGFCGEMMGAFGQVTGEDGEVTGEDRLPIDAAELAMYEIGVWHRRGPAEVIGMQALSAALLRVSRMLDAQIALDIASD